MYHHTTFYPSDWWDRLSDDTIDQYGEIFDYLPLAVHTKNNAIACHGLPMTNLDNDIELGSPDWTTLIWGRLTDQFCTEHYIQSVLEGNGANMIIRSHDHYGLFLSHNDRVITFTTSANLPNTKQIVIEVNLTKKIRDIQDVTVIDLDKETI